MTRSLRIAALAAAIALPLNACGGGSGAAPPGALPKSKVTTARVSLQIPVGGQSSTSSAKVRYPQFVSPNASSVSVVVNNGSPQIFDVSVSSSLCSTSNSMRTCTLNISASSGNDTFTFTIYAGANATGTVLATATQSEQLSAGSTFSFTVAMNAVIGTVVASTAGSQNASCGSTTIIPSITELCADSVVLSVSAYDPTGAPITGSAAFASPLSVSVSPADPTLSLSPTTITSPTTTSTLTYSGAAITASITNSIALNVSLGGQLVGSVNVTVFRETSNGLTIVRYALPGSTVGTPGTNFPVQIVVGPDNNLWTVENLKNKVDRITTSGAITQFATGFGGSPFPVGIAKGSDGNIWFNDGNCTIGRISTSGTLQSSVTIPPGTGCSLWFMTQGPDGNVWFIAQGINSVGYVDSGLTPHVFTIPTSNAINYVLDGITAGPDNAVWFSESGASKIARVPTNASSGAQITEYSTPTPASMPLGIALGPDGNLWFVEFNSDLYAKITTSGVITEYSGVINPAAFANPVIITAGPDGNMWIPQGGGAVRFSTSSPTTATIPLFNDTAQTDDKSVVAGPDGNLWFTGLGSAGGGGFNPTADEVAKFTP
jgi:streptogramin lyase